MLNLNSKSEILDKTIEAILYSLLAFCPLVFGAVHAWSEQVVITLSGAMLICFLVRLIVAGEGFRWTWAYVPVAAFVLIAAFQLIPLPVSIVSAISPNTVSVKTELLSTLPAHVRPALDTMTLSFYSNASKHDLRIIFAIASVFVVVVSTFRTGEQVKRLLTAVTIVGAGVAFIALAQVVTLTDSIYWLYKVPGKLADSGPFVNHSHYGQFMNLSIGAALGLLLVKLHSVFTGKKVSPSVALEHCMSQECRSQWYIVGFIVVAAATVFVSLTRGGMLSMLIAAAFTTLVLSSRQSIKGRGWIMTVMALGAFVCVLYIGFDAVYDRFATLNSGDQYTDRWTMFTSIAAEFKQFPLLGTGIGTYSVIYPMFDNTLSTHIATHAENEYAQAIAETGFIGFSFLCVFGIIVWSAFVKNVRAAQHPVRSAAYGLGFGLLAILIHSLSDFGQHLPANAILTATFSALMIALTRIKPEALAVSDQRSAISSQTAERSEAAESRLLNAESSIPKAKRIAVMLLLAATSAILFLSFTSANSYRLSESHFAKSLKVESTIAERDWQAGNLEYKQLIDSANLASLASPGNVKYRHWLNVYRWRSLSRYTSPDTGVVDPDTGNLILPPQWNDWIRQLTDGFYEAIAQCPTYGPSWCMAGQLESSIIGDNHSGTAMIEKGYKLAPCDPTVCLIAGQQEVINYLDSEESKANGQGSKQSGDPDFTSGLMANGTAPGFDRLSRAVTLNGGLFTEVASIYIDQLNRPDLALDLAGEDIYRLSRIAGMLAASDANSELTETTRAYITDLLEKRALEADAPAHVFVSLANVYRKEQSNDKAIDCYKKALAIDYGQTAWRYTLATLLAKQNQQKEAIHQARIVLRLNPNHKQAKKLIADLSVEVNH